MLGLIARISKSNSFHPKPVSVVAIASIFVLANDTAFGQDTTPVQIELPNLVEKTPAEAETILTDLGVAYEITDVMPVACGRKEIVAQEPPPTTTGVPEALFVFLRQNGVGQNMPDFIGQRVANTAGLGAGAESVVRNLPRVSTSTSSANSQCSLEVVERIVRTVPTPGSCVLPETTIIIHVDRREDLTCLELCGDIPC